MLQTPEEGKLALVALIREQEPDWTDLQVATAAHERRIGMGDRFDATRYVSDLDRARKAREQERHDELRAADAKKRRELIAAEVDRHRNAKSTEQGGGHDVQQHVAHAKAIAALQSGPSGYLWARDRDATLAVEAAADVRRTRPWLYALTPAAPTSTAPTRSAKRSAADVARERLDREADAILAVSPLAQDPSYAITGERAKGEAADLDAALAKLYARKGKRNPPKIGAELMRCHGLEARRALLRGHLAAAGICPIPTGTTSEPLAKPATTMREQATQIASIALEPYTYDDRLVALERQLVKHGDRRAARRMLDAALRAGDDRVSQSRELVRLLRGGAR